MHLWQCCQDHRSSRCPSIDAQTLWGIAVACTICHDLEEQSSPCSVRVGFK
jgi:hypothetical protein